MSEDFRCTDQSTSIDSSLTMVMGDDMVKVGLALAPFGAGGQGGGQQPRGHLEGAGSGTQHAARVVSVCGRSPLPFCGARLPPPSPPLEQVVAWYDNEWGYSQRVVDLAELTAAKWE